MRFNVVFWSGNHQMIINHESFISYIWCFESFATLFVADVFGFLFERMISINKIVGIITFKKNLNLKNDIVWYSVPAIVIKDASVLNEFSVRLSLPEFQFWR